MPANKVITYSRVSTEREQSPDAQRAELSRYCAARNWVVTAEIVDHGFSGGTDKRPGLKQLLALVRTRKVDTVVVLKMDRLARSLRHLLSLLDEFSTLGVTFVSIGDQVDMSTPTGRLMTHLLGAFAEFERALVRERTMLGLAHARLIGKRLGRPKLRDDHTIQKLRAEGLSYRAIRHRLGVSMGAVSRALRAAPKSPPSIPTSHHKKTGG